MGHWGAGKHSALEFQHALVDVRGEPDLHAELSAQNNDEFLKLKGQALVGLQSDGRIPGKWAPDLHQKLAGHGCDSGVAIAFAGEEFPTPFSKRRICAQAL